MGEDGVVGRCGALGKGAGVNYVRKWSKIGNLTIKHYMDSEPDVLFNTRKTISDTN
jgi:hypothetical protein